MSRSQALKARSSLATLNVLFRSGAWPDAGRWQMRVERIASSAHEIVEIQLLSDLWLGDLQVRDEAQASEMERLLGGLGTTTTARLGLPDDAPVDAQRAAALSARERWMRIAEHPLSSARLRSAAREVARTCEGVLVRVATAAPVGPVGPPPAGRWDR
jgi:hypothetical protein